MGNQKFDVRTWIREAAQEKQDKAVEEMSKEIEKLNQDWAGGDNLEHSVDHTKSSTGLESIKHPEVDGLELSESHFEPDGDEGISACGIGNPDLASQYERKASRSMIAVPCPESYASAAQALVESPYDAEGLLTPLMEATGATCPASVARALADLIDVAQALGIVGSLK